MNAGCRILNAGPRLIKKLKKVHIKHFQHIDPNEILVINVYDVGKQKFLGRIRNIPVQFRPIISDNYSEINYIIEINRDSIHNKVNGNKKQYKELRNIVIFHELFHIHPKKHGHLRGHTVADFVEVLKTVGLSAWTKTKDFPNIMKRKVQK